MSWSFGLLMLMMLLFLLNAYATWTFAKSRQLRLRRLMSQSPDASSPLTGHGSGSSTGSLCLYREYPVPTSCRPVGLHGSSVRP